MKGQRRTKKGRSRASRGLAIVVCLLGWMSLLAGPRGPAQARSFEPDRSKKEDKQGATAKSTKTQDAESSTFEKAVEALPEIDPPDANTAIPKQDSAAKKIDPPSDNRVAQPEAQFPKTVEKSKPPPKKTSSTSSKRPTSNGKKTAPKVPEKKIEKTELQPPVSQAGDDPEVEPSPELPAKSSDASAPSSQQTKISSDTPKYRWTLYQVRSGDTAIAIARRYGVSLNDLAKWNRLPNVAHLRVGQKLRVRVRVRETAKRSAPVESKSPPTSVAAKGISAEKSSPTTATRPSSSGAKRSVSVATDKEVYRNPPVLRKAAAAKQEVRRGLSIGLPDRGMLAHGVQLRPQPGVFTVRDSAAAWGSSETVRLLSEALLAFHRTRSYPFEVVVQAMSRESGGRFPPHRSHQSGRDVDIRLPVIRKLGAGGVAASASQVDWRATWKLIDSLLASGRVVYIFLDFKRQKLLRKAAIRAGASRSRVDALLQWPSRKPSRSAMIRHSPGHTSHLHVRFRCATTELFCEER